MKLPNDWHYAEIGSVATVNRAALTSKTDPNQEFLYLELSAVDQGAISVPELPVKFKDAPSRARRLLKQGDVLMSMVRPNLQGFAFLGSDVHNLVASTGFAVLTATHADPRFIYQSLYSHKITAQLSRLLVGSGYPAINSTDVEELVIAIPKKENEQRKIADILTTWDEAQSKLDALIKAQECRKKALLHELLTGKKRLPSFAKKTWEKVRIGEVLTRVFRPIEWSAEMPLSLVSLRRRCGGLFRRPDMLGADYKTQDLHELRADDFLISKRQVVHGAWGLVTPDFAGTHVSKEYAIFVNSAPTQLHMPFFAWLCQTPRMIRLARVASTGVHIEKLIFDPDVFLRDSIRIPCDIEEQRKITNILNTADKQLNLLRTQRTALDQQKRGLMQRLLTGKLRVKTTEHSHE